MKSLFRQFRNRHPGAKGLRAVRPNLFRPCIEQLESRDLLSAAGAVSGQIQETYGQIPLSFEANQGQTDARVRFLARGSGYSLFLTPDQAVLRLQKAGHAEAGDVLAVSLVGGNANPQMTGLDRQEAVSNYFVGDDPRAWRSGVATYARVRYANVYPGIDLIYYGNQRQLEYDFVVAPGADPGGIKLSFAGAQNLELNGQGDLVVHTAGGDVVEHAPVLYQEGRAGREPVVGRYELRGNHEVGFVVGTHDPERPLVVDPVLVYSTYLGGTGSDSATAVAVDAGGNAFITGNAQSTNFPTTTGAFQTGRRAQNVFIAKLNAAGTSLVYSTYLGGTGFDSGTAIAVDAAGSAYVTGDTTSTDFPTTPGAFQTTKRGISTNAFVTKLNAAGTSLLYSTYLGGGSAELGDLGRGIAVDATGGAYVIGATGSLTFPTTAGAFQTTLRGTRNAFVTKLNGGGTGLLYSTYLGGTGFDSGAAIAVSATGNAYVTGDTNSTNFPTTAGAFQTRLNGANNNAFATKLNTNGTALVYSTYLGGSGTTFTGDDGMGIAVDGAGEAFVTGSTSSTNFPTTATAYQGRLRGTQNAFVTKLNVAGTAAVYSTYLGGTHSDNGGGVAIDSAGNAYVVGSTSSPDFPTTAGAIQTTLRGSQNVFLTKLNAGGSGLVYATYLGGAQTDNGNGVAVDGTGNAYVVGDTSSANFPTTTGIVQGNLRGTHNAFVARVDTSGPATHLRVIPSATTVTAGAPGFTITVQALDASDTPASTYRGTVAFSSSDPAAVLPGPYTFTAGDSGVHTFTVTLKTAGSRTVTAADNAFTASATVTVTPAAASMLIVAGFPPLIPAGNAGTFTVTAQDPYGNIATGYLGTLQFTSSDAQALLPGSYTFTVADAGTHAFSGTLRTPGTQSLTATDSAAELSGTQAGIIVTPGTLAPTTTTLLSNLASVKLGGPVTLSARVTTAAGGTPTTGTITFYDGTTILCTTDIRGAVCAPVLSLGRHSLTARYNGDFTVSPPLAPSTSPPVVVVVRNAAFFAVGGANGRVQIRRTVDGSLVTEFTPYSSAVGAGSGTDTGGLHGVPPPVTGSLGVTVAMGDVNGDGYDDLVTGTTAGNPHVKVYDGRAIANGTFNAANPDASLLASFFAYGLNFNVGANVAVGDIEHNGYADIVTGATAGNPNVKVYRGRDIATGTFQPDGASLVASFFAYGLNFNIGANVAVGDIEGNGCADIATGATAGNPDVKVYNGQAIANGNVSLRDELFPFSQQANVGAFVALGANAGSFPELIVGASTGNPEIKVYSLSFVHGLLSRQLTADFFAFDLGQNAGATVAQVGFGANANADILTGNTRGTPSFRVLRDTASGVKPPAVFESSLPGFPEGVFVGA